jgi:hypothetical protein
MEFAIELMSGTSTDRIDVAEIWTDGLSSVEPFAFRFDPHCSESRLLIAEACCIVIDAHRPRDDPMKAIPWLKGLIRAGRGLGGMATQ